MIDVDSPPLAPMCAACGAELMLTPSGHHFCADPTCTDGFGTDILRQLFSEAFNSQADQASTGNEAATIERGANSVAATLSPAAMKSGTCYLWLCFQLLDDRLSVVANFGNRGLNLKPRFSQTLAPMTRHILAGYIDPISRSLPG